MSKEIVLVDIAKTKMLSVYLHELFYLCSSIKRECEEVFKEAQVLATGYAIQVSPMLHSRINSVLIYAANIKKLISTPEHKSKGETRKKYQLRKQRVALFSDVLTGISTAELSNSKVRNTVEHFEEYLDDLNLELLDLQGRFRGKHSVAAYNMTFSEWQVTNPAAYPVRLYIAKEKTLYNFDWSINIGKICEEASEILSRLEGMKPFNDLDEQPGGLMIGL